MKLSGDIWGKTMTAVTMAMPGDGAHVRSRSDRSTCGTRPESACSHATQSKVRDGNQWCPGRASRPAVPPAWIRGKMGTHVAFARRAAAAAGAVAGLQWRGARGGAPLDVQHSRPAQPEQPLQPVHGGSGRPPVRREAGH